VATTVAGLFADGYGRQLLISHDIGVRSRLTAYGSWGYAHIPRHIVPLLAERGLGEADVAQLLRHNPARLLAVEGL
jgi:phosphotriesterase-related protein